MNHPYSTPIRTIVLLFAASLLPTPGAMAQSSTESLLNTDNAYNPVPSPDGRSLAYVRISWGESEFFSLGRSSLVSEVKIMNVEGPAAPRTLAKGYFLSGWTPDSASVVCYRDWKYSVVPSDGTLPIEGRTRSSNFTTSTEWVAYSPILKTVIWNRADGNAEWVIETPYRTLTKPNPFRGRVVPSPDGRYLAVFGDYLGTQLAVYDLQLESWQKLGTISIHPDSDWSYIQPNWNPWFADGSRLVFLRDSALVIVNPDGRNKIEIKIDGTAGLPAPSPDGQSIAYVTFDPRAMQVRPDLKFWGGTTIMVVPVFPGAEARAITVKNPDEVYDLKWLNDGVLVFDRIADEMFYRHARIWKVSVPR